MDTHLKQDSLIEDALKSQPLAPMPRSLTADVLTRIQLEKRPSFLTWNDFVLSAVITICIAALWFTWQHLPPIVLAKLHMQGVLLYQDFIVSARWLAPLSLFGIEAFLVVIGFPALIKLTFNLRQ